MVLSEKIEPRFCISVLKHFRNIVGADYNILPLAKNSRDERYI